MRISVSLFQVPNAGNMKRLLLVAVNIWLCLDCFSTGESTDETSTIISGNETHRSVFFDSDVVPDYKIVLGMEHPREFISSPGFPDEYYPNNIQIIYEVKVQLADEVAQRSTRILLTFEMFALEQSVFCAKDGLEVEDESNQVRVFCDCQVGRTILSEGSTIRIRFFTDSDITSRGFSIRLEMFNTECSKLFKGVRTGEFSTPNFPNRYYSGDLCVWKIEAPEGKRIRVKFDGVFDVRAYEPLCVQDYLAVSKSGDLSQDVTRYCHTTRPSPIESTSNNMLFVFRSDCCFEGKGFFATFAIIDADEVTTLPPLKPRPEPCRCGEENADLVDRIVGGNEVEPANKYPWVAAVVKKKKFICVGALINRQYVLTASHCLYKETTSTISVALGVHDVTSDPDILEVSNFITHPNYTSKNYLNDIALLKLKDPITFSEKVKPVCLPPFQEFAKPDDIGVIAGWGRDMQGGKESDVLMEVKLGIVSNAHCVSKYGGIILDTNICAGGEEGKDACQGDSGGSLFTKKDSKYYSVGIASWGIGCGRKGHPGVYTRISNFVKWIDDNSADAPSCVDTDPPIQPNLEDCGIPNSVSEDRIAGGTETESFQYPWMAMVVYNKTVVGAGALINPQYVLTAASVFDAWMEWYPEIIDVFLGKHDLTKKEATSQRFGVRSVYHHPQYGKPSPYNNDMALLKLNVPLSGVPKMYRPICLPRSSTWYSTGDTLVTAGWGRTSTYGRGSDVLLQAKMNIVSQSQCKKDYPGWVTDQMVCAYNYGKDTCEGDSGAPLMKFIKGRYYLAGLSSWASKDGCAITGAPRVFSAVHRNLKWISVNTGLQTA